MRTKRIKLFTFEELTSEAQKTAIENERNNAYEFVELDFLKDDAEGQLSTVGFENAKLSYSLTNCQGDGLSFKADINLSYFLDLFAPNRSQWFKDIIYNNITVNCIGNNGRYCFASRHDIEINYSFCSTYYSNIYDFVSRLDDFITDLYIAECEKLEKQGYDKIDYQCSDDYIKEGFISNGTEFLSDGTKY